MKRIGEDVAEKLDYQPGVFTVERHVRGKWVCACCETLVQAPVAPHIIDKGIPTTGLLAQVLVAKYLDHLPLYRQEAIFERAGLAIARSTLAQWVGECGVQLQPLVDALEAEMLQHTRAARRRDAGGDAQAGQRQDAPGLPVELLHDAASTRSRRWSSTSPTAAAGSMCASFLGLPGTEQNRLEGQAGDATTSAATRPASSSGVTEVGCLAHARRKFHELWANHGSQVGEQALKFFIQLYEVEREVRDLRRRRAQGDPAGQEPSRSPMRCTSG